MKVLYGARIFDGERLRGDGALVVEGASVQALTRLEDRPRAGKQVDLGGGILSPGFIDWQINGAAACCSTPLRPLRESPRSPRRIDALA